MIMNTEQVMVLNFTADLLLLYGTERILQIPGSWRRYLLAAVLGGVYGAGCCMPGFTFLANGFWKILCTGCICLVAFGIGIATLRAGTMFFVLRIALESLASGWTGGVAWWILFSLAVFWILCALKPWSCQVNGTCLPVEITWGGKVVQVTALLDSGNMLKDPISGWPVLVADPTVARALLGISSEQLAQPLKTIMSGNIMGLRLIPYHSVGQAGGMLLGIRADQVVVDGKIKEMIVAFSPNPIGSGKQYSALAGGTV